MDGMSIRLMKDGGQIMDYNASEMPVLSSVGRVANFADGICPYHWHEDFEFFVALQGSAYYTVNGRRLDFAEGDGIFVNARQLHASGSEKGQVEEDYVLCFPANVLHCGDVFFHRYVEPVVQRGPAACVLRQADPQQARCLKALHAARALGETELPAPALAARLFALWEVFIPVVQPLLCDVPPGNTEDLAAQKRMVQFIYENYPHKIALADIAAAGSVSRSKCCALFRQYLHRSPVEYLNHYRIVRAENLLRTTDAPVTEIALRCGFSSPSYFAESFARLQGCTPSACRTFGTKQEGR